jgi:hypothetical protein
VIIVPGYTSRDPACKPAVEPPDPPILAVSSGLKWSELQADNSLPSSSEDKNDGVVPPLSHLCSCRDA